MLEILTNMLTSRIHETIVFLQPMVSAYESLVLLKFTALSFPGFALCILGQTISTCMNVRAMQLDNRYYWLHSLLLVVLTGFGGGIAGFMMLGKPPIIVTNEIILPICVICWYATHYLGLCPLLALPPFKLIWTIFASLFRSLSLFLFPSHLFFPSNSLLFQNPCDLQYCCSRV